MSTRRMMVASEAVEPEEWRGSNVIPKAWKQEETISDGWSKIVENCQNGTYKDKYKIGDTKIADFGVQGLCMMQIVAFDEDDLADGSGKAHITWVSRNAWAEARPQNWNWVPTGISLLPSALQEAIPLVNRWGSKQWVTNNNPSPRKIFVLTIQESGDSRWTNQTDYLKPHNYVGVPSQPVTNGLVPNGVPIVAWLANPDVSNYERAYYGQGMNLFESNAYMKYACLYTVPCFCL